MGRKCAAWIGISIEIDNSQIHRLGKTANNMHARRAGVSFVLELLLSLCHNSTEAAADHTDLYAPASTLHHN